MSKLVPVEQGVAKALLDTSFMKKAGMYSIVDGQFGSTGKGLLAAVMGEVFSRHNALDCVTSNAGPNSGHTFYYRDEKIVLRQLPSAAVWKACAGLQTYVHLNAGSIIIPNLLIEEIRMYGGPNLMVTIDPMAAVVTSDAVAQEKELVGAVGSTGKGTGAALANKIMRKEGAVMMDVFYDYEWPENTWLKAVNLGDGIDQDEARILMEVSQGFSLSLNASGFYPYCTSRDCTVAAAMSDAGVHPSLHRGCAMVVRTFPIRVAGNSGSGYPDQHELSWEQVGQTPELTTVTQKERRIFSWSKMQYVEALKANRPEIIMSNFMNYLPEGVDHYAWVRKNIVHPYEAIFGKPPELVLLGYGPENADVEVYQ